MSTFLRSGAPLALAMALVGPVLAADLPVQPPPVPAAAFTWSGFYLGGQIGYAWARDNAFLSVVPPVGATPIGASNVAFTTNPQGVIGGAHIGYNYQVGSLVLGLEGEVNGTNTHRTAQPLDFVTSTTNSYVQGMFLGRLGLAFDRVLVFATGGGGYAGITNTYNVLGSGNSFSTTRSGWTIGGGLEYAIDDHWSARVDYRYADFGNFTDRPIVFPGIFERHHWTQQQVRVGFSYKFTPRAPAAVVSKF